MGNSLSRFAAKNPKFITINVDTLRDRLNQLYNSRLTLPNEGMFEYLWDLKEQALMDGASTVDVPTNWLDDLEDSDFARSA